MQFESEWLLQPQLVHRELQHGCVTYLMLYESDASI